MDQVLHNIENDSDTVEIIVHIAGTLEEQRRRRLAAALRNVNGIVSAEFCTLRYHLMLIRYDRDLYSSQDVVAKVKSHNVYARLVGWA